MAELFESQVRYWYQDAIIDMTTSSTPQLTAIKLLSAAGTFDQRWTCIRSTKEVTTRLKSGCLFVLHQLSAHEALVDNFSSLPSSNTTHKHPPRSSNIGSKQIDDQTEDLEPHAHHHAASNGSDDCPRNSRYRLQQHDSFWPGTTQQTYCLTS